MLLNIAIISIFIENYHKQEGDPFCELAFSNTITFKLFGPFNLKLYCFNGFFVVVFANGFEIMHLSLYFAFTLYKYFSLLL